MEIDRNSVVQTNIYVGHFDTWLMDSNSTGINKKKSDQPRCIEKPRFEHHLVLLISLKKKTNLSSKILHLSLLKKNKVHKDHRSLAL